MLLVHSRSSGNVGQMNKNSILEKETMWRNETKFLFKTRKNYQVNKEPFPII